MTEFRVVTYKISNSEKISTGQWIQDKGGLLMAFKQSCRRIENRMPEIYHTFETRPEESIKASCKKGCINKCKACQKIK